MRNYQTKSNLGALPDSNAPTKLGGGEASSLRDEGKNAVTPAGLTLAPQDGTGEDVTQLAQSLFIHAVKSAHFVDGGAVNTIELVPTSGASGVTLPPTADNYTNLDGAHFTFNVGFVNVGAVTVSIGQTAGTQFPVKPLVHEDGSTLSIGDLSPSIETVIRFNLSADRFELIERGVQRVISGTNVSLGGNTARPVINVLDASVTVKGAVELATDAETQAGVDSSRAVTTTGLASVFTQSSGNPAFFRIEVGSKDFIFQYGSIAVLGLTNNTLVTYPISFTGASQVVLTADDSDVTHTENYMVNSTSGTSFQITNTSNASQVIRWLAFGPS